MVNQDLQRLRAEARRAHRLATAKVSRLRAKGVELGGSELDPRRDLNSVKRYNARQLNAYIRQLDTFRDRNTIPTVQGRSLLSGAQVREYKRLEREYNQIAKRSQVQASRFRLPSGLTVGQRDKALRPEFPTGLGQRRPLDPITRNIRFVKDEKALGRLIKDLRRKLSPDYERKTLKRQRTVANKMLKGTGNASLRKQLQNLTDQQFNILWNYTDFSTHVSTKYHTDPESTAKWVAERAETSEGQISELINWAKKLGKK